MPLSIPVIAGVEAITLTRYPIPAFVDRGMTEGIAPLLEEFVMEPMITGDTKVPVEPDSCAVNTFPALKITLLLVNETSIELPEQYVRGNTGEVFIEPGVYLYVSPLAGITVFLEVTASVLIVPVVVVDQDTVPDLLLKSVLSIPRNPTWQVSAIVEVAVQVPYIISMTLLVSFSLTWKLSTSPKTGAFVYRLAFVH